MPKTVKVRVTDGVVTLQGSVLRLVGVKGILNEIVLNPKASAAGVKIKIDEALKRNAEIDASHIQVETSDGTVTLRGNVRSWMEREEAENAAWAALPRSKTVSRSVVKIANSGSILPTAHLGEGGALTAFRCHDIWTETKS